jgi:large subunit ribosomal protein L10
MNKEQKAESIAEIAALLEKASGLYLADFSGMTVEQANNLRREFHRIGAEYKVVKNTLARRAFDRIGGYDEVSKYLVGPTGIVIGYDDPIAPARTIKKFTETTQKPSVKACIIEKQIFDGSRLAEVASLPTRLDLMAGIIGAIQSPMAGLAGVVSALARDIVTLVDAIEKKKAEASAA